MKSKITHLTDARCGASRRSVFVRRLRLVLGGLGISLLGAGISAPADAFLLQQNLENRVEAVRAAINSQDAAGKTSIPDKLAQRWNKRSNGGRWNKRPSWSNWGNWFNR